MTTLLEEINKTKKLCRLGDLVSINEQSISGSFPYKEIEYIDTSSVTQNNFDKPQILKVNEAPSRAKRLVKDGDTIISTVRPNLKHFGFIKNPKANTVVSTGFAVVRAKKIDPLYLYSYLTQNPITLKLSAIAEATTTTFPAFRPEILEEMEIEVPDLPVQKRVGEILRAYDAKIENNTFIIKNLELMAQTIFDEWFLKLHFPGHQNTNATEDTDWEIPKGWRVGKFTDYISVLGGGTPSTTVQKYWNGEIPFFTPKDVGDGFYSLKTEKHLTKDGLENCNSKLYSPNTVFITARGTVGKIALSGTSMAMNQSCYALQGKNALSSFFVLLLTRNLIKELQQVAIGGVFDTITTSTFEHTEILMPEQSLIKKFDDVIKPIFNQILSLNLENQILNNSRDQLLAKLI